MRDDHYEVFPSEHTGDTARYPSNHVQFATPLKILGSLYRLGYALRIPMLLPTRLLAREYSRARELDGVLGTRAENDAIHELAMYAYDRIAQSPHISPPGHFLLWELTRNGVGWRRRMLEFHRDNREKIDQGRVVAPILITGTPRSGTTLLQRLISEDPDTRSPYTFELEALLPPLDADTDPLKDPRIEASSQGYNTLQKLAPGMVEKFAESHLWSATEMEECFLYMMAVNGLFLLNGPHAGQAYMERLMEPDGKDPIFRFEKLFIQTLDAWRPAPSHWTLKAPNYAPWFGGIFETYPDARVVLTHRNPLTTLPSACRLVESWDVVFNRDGHFDKHQFAETVRPFVEACILHPLEYRDAHPERETQIFDCMYTDLFADPVEMVKRVYAHFEMDVSPEFEARMRSYLANNQQGKYGRHRYSLEEYGLDPERLIERWRPYMDRYGYGIPEKRERAKTLKAVAD